MEVRPLVRSLSAAREDSGSGGGGEGKGKTVNQQEEKKRRREGKKERKRKKEKKRKKERERREREKEEEEEEEKKEKKEKKKRKEGRFVGTCWCWSLNCSTRRSKSLPFSQHTCPPIFLFISFASHGRWLSISTKFSFPARVIAITHVGKDACPKLFFSSSVGTRLAKTYAL